MATDRDTGEQIGDTIELACTNAKDRELSQTDVLSIINAVEVPEHYEGINSHTEPHHGTTNGAAGSSPRKEEPALQRSYKHRGASMTVRDDEYRERIEGMIAKGWCSHHVLHLYRTVTSPMFIRLSYMSLSPLRCMDHSRCLNHNSCVIYNVDMDAYDTRHCNGCSGCPFLTINNDELVSIIKGGDVPLVSIEVDKETQNLSLRLHKQRQFSNYTAISHVWADGLGNTNANALPICQLMALRARLKRVYGKSKNMFWIDTLCIPVGEEHIDSRNSSIDAMGLIYASSSLVLVLDRELMTVSPHDDPEECLARIFTSVWMSRSWTLQEGVLARLCAFEFKDVVMTVREGVGLSNIERNGTAHRGPGLVEVVPGLGLTTTSQATTSQFYRHATRRYLNVFSSGFGQLGNHGRFTFVWNELSGRSTTKCDDIFIILANVLGFSCQSFLALSSDERIAAIILTLDYIPFSLFLISVPRREPSRLHPNNWFPKSIGVEKLCQELPLLERSNKYLTINSRAGCSHRLAIFIVWSLFSPTISNQRMYYTDGELIFICKVDSDNVSQFDLSGHQFSCIIVDRAPSQNKDKFRGAIFFGSRSFRHWKYVKLNLTYRCSATFETIAISETEITGQEPEMERVRGAYQVNIAYESNSRLRKFHKRASTTMYANAFMAKCWPWLTVAAFVSLIASFVSVFWLGDPHRWIGALLFAATTIFTLMVVSVPVVRLIHDRLARKRRLKLNRAFA